MPSVLDNNSAQFVIQVSNGTGIDPRVLTAWVVQEGANAPGGTGGYNYLNLSANTQGNVGQVGVSPSGFAQFSSVNAAAISTINRLKQPFASSILSTASSKPTPSVQIAAIAGTGWDAGHYGGPGGPNLQATFARIFGGPTGLTTAYQAPNQATNVVAEAGSGSAADFTSTDLSSVQKLAADAAQHIPGVKQAEAVSSGIHSIGDFVHELSNPNFWIRVAEVIGGVMLVGLGLYVTVKDMGMNPPSLPGPLGALQEDSTAKVRELELANRQTAAENRSANLGFQAQTAVSRSETQSSEFENRQKIARERYLQARAKTREKRATARAAESGATAASRRAERAKSIQMEEIESLGIFR